MAIGPSANARYFAADEASLRSGAAPSAVPAPPGSGSTVRTRTTASPGELELDMELEASFIAKPEDSMLRLRASRSDISAAKLKLYHEHCNRRLEHTLQLFRLREERERLSVSRGAKKQRVAGAPDVTLEARDRQWKLIRESNDVRVYRHIRRKQRVSTMMACGTIHGSLADVMSGLYADTTKDSQVLHTLLSSQFLDAGVLHVDRRGDDHEPFQFSGITWTALRTPGLFFCKNRDLLCFKKMDCFKDDYGDEFGYLVLQSIEPTDECAKAILSKASRYVRGYISVGMLFKKQADDLVSLFVHGEFNPNGRLSPAFGDACFAGSIVALANTPQSGQAKNLSMLLHSFSAAPARKPSGDRCSVCARSLFFWAAPRPCRACWQPTCRACRVKRPIFCAALHRAQHAGGKAQAPCTEAFCLQCVASAVPSGVTTRAKLLRQLEKKRARAGSGAGHRQTISSSAAESAAGRAAALHAAFAPDDLSSISAASLHDSDKLQQHRLSLPKRARPASMVDVVEHLETAQRAPFRHAAQRLRAQPVSAAASSSIPSLVSFSSNDAGTISDFGSAAPRTNAASFAAVPTGARDYRVGTRQYHMDVLAAGLKRDGAASGTGGAQSFGAARTDEYYQKVLQRYLRSNRSYISINSNVTSASSRHAPTDREDVSTVVSAVDSASTGSGASLATADLYFKRL